MKDEQGDGLTEDQVRFVGLLNVSGNRNTHLRRMKKIYIKKTLLLKLTVRFAIGKTETRIHLILTILQGFAEKRCWIKYIDPTEASDSVGPTYALSIK